jgi:hypothetical protein
MVRTMLKTNDKVVLLDSPFNQSRNVVSLTGTIKFDTIGKFVYTDCGKWIYYFINEVNQNIKKVE